jgi:hypothetical protein
LNATSAKTSERSTWAERAGKPETSDEANGYKAFEAVRAESRPVLELRLKNGLSYGVNYAHLRGFRCMVKDDHHSLTLYSDMGLIIIKGLHLGDLKEKLFSHAVLWVRVLDKEKGDTYDKAQKEPVVFELLFHEAGDDETTHEAA